MSYNAEPTRYDHQLIIGDTYRVVANLKDSTGAVIDITGLTGECKIKAEVSGNTIAEPTVSIVTAASGQLEWTLASAATTALSPMRCKYYVKVTFASGEKKTIAQGHVSLVQPEEF